MSTWNLNRIEQAFAEAAVAPDNWVRALDIVTEETSARGTILLPITGNALPNVPYTAALAACTETYFKEGWDRRDERHNGIPALIRNGIADDFDALPHDRMTRHPYYQELLARHRLQWFAGVRVSHGADVWCISIQRGIGDAPFSPEEKRRLLRLTQSLPGSVGMAKMFGAATGNSVLETFELSQTAAVLVSRQGLVVRPNQAAEVLLQGAVRIRQRKIVCHDAAANAALDRALFAVLHGLAGGLSAPVKLPRPGRHPLLAYPGRLAAFISNALSESQAVVILRDPDARKEIRPATLRDVFELTEAEARLAIHLSSGATLEDACLQLMISKETGRSRLKAIFEKTGAHRQVDLMMLLHGLPV